ncbi:MAG TPA: hypothetical protein VJT82_11520, partial [Pyrinomonadaceae bacterium]|nr:hypothetical protein [Pyrinomonadaceae bacterium]
EGLRLRQPQVAITDVPSLAARQNAPAALRPFLAAFPLPTGATFGNGFAEFAAAYSDPSSLDAASLRLDAVLTPRATLFGRYNHAPSRTLQRRGVTTPGFGGQSVNTVNSTSLKTQTLTVGATASLSSKTTNDLRFNWSASSGATSLLMDDFGGAVVVPASLLFPPFASPATSGFRMLLRGGMNANFGVGRIVDNRQRQLNVVENLSVVRGSHQLKFGADFRRLTPTYNPLRYMQSVVFGDGTTTGAAATATGKAYQVQISAEAETRAPVFTNFSAYAQDTWRASPRLTFTYGVRWELNPPPTERRGNAPFTVTGLDLRDGSVVFEQAGSTPLALAPRGTPLWRTTYANFAPRFGAAYQLSRTSGTVLRGGLGIFYDLGDGQAGQAFGGVFPYHREKLLSNVAFPVSPALAEPPPLTLDPPYGALFAFDPRLKLPYALQWNLSVEQPLGASESLTVSYVASAGRRLLRETALVNPSSAFTVVRAVSNTSASDYHSLQAQFQRRLARGVQAMIFYTWAHAIDDDSDDSSNVFLQRGASFDHERGASNFDVRHSLTAVASYTLPRPVAGGSSFARALTRDWTVDAIFRARTATPVNVFRSTGVVIGDLIEVQRPSLVAGVPPYLDDRTVAGGRRINPAAFAFTPGGQGTLGRNALRGFGFSQLDAALRRQFSLTERLNLQLRAEVFNVLNHPNFGDPAGDLSDRLFGQATQMLGRSLGTGGVNGGLSPLYQIGGARSVQLAVKLQF